MENFVLNLFSDQLSKIIQNFHQSTINANFLSGKGSITNVKLNVDIINDFLNKPPHGTVPFLEFEEITLTELRVEVTSYTNLKKAPIVLVIEEIHAKAREPLEYHVDPAANIAHKKKTEAAAAALLDQQSNKKKPNPSSTPQQYGLLHRIIDNLSIKIKRIHLSFSSLGKFKTRRVGIWTPPTLQVCLDNVEWISVTETGYAGTPDQCWAHNDLGAQQSRFKRESNNNANQQQQHRSSHHRSYIIYKRLSMLCHVKLLSGSGSGGGTSSSWNGGQQQQTQSANGLNFIAPSSQQKHVFTKQQQQQQQQESSAVSNLISDTRVDVHVAYTRRLRDAGVTGADMDVKVHDVNIDLDVASYNDHRRKTTAKSSTGGCDLGAFVHMLVGLLHCYYKDRSFVDPLLPDGVFASSHNSSGSGDGKEGQKGDNGGLLRGFSREEDTIALQHGNDNEKEEEEAGPDDFLPTVSLMDDDLESSDDSDYEEEPDEEHDEAYLEWKRKQDQKEGKEIGAAKSEESTGELSLQDGQDIESDGIIASKEKGGSVDHTTTTTAKSYKRKRKAVIVIASGAQQFEKLSFSLSIPRINMKLCLPSEESNAETNANGEKGDSEANDNHCLELLLEGLVAECIWPKVSGEMGGHVQGAIKYCHILESVYHKDWGTTPQTGFGPKPWNVVKIFPLIRLGRRLFEGHDSFSLSSKLSESQNIVSNESFVQMEDRGTTWKWDQQLQGPRALSFKSTISFIDETLTQWSKTSCHHEASVGEISIVLDSAPIERMIKLFSDPSHQDNLWFDERWLSGDWHSEIDTNSMIASGSSNSGFYLKNHIQPLPSLYPSKNSKQPPLSSELRSITTHLESFTVTLPNPMQDLSSFRMADVVFNISEATILVSSDLPSSFLAGEVTPESTSSFPHDPTDISSLAGAKDNSSNTDEVTKFRMQISLLSCSIKVVPVQASSLNLIDPTNVTMMMSLEQQNAGEQLPNNKDESVGQLLSQRSLIFSVLIQAFVSNIELRSLYGALETFTYHTENVIKYTSSGDINESQVDTAEECNSSSIICIHVPELEVSLWGEKSNKLSPINDNEAKTTSQDNDLTLLCRVKASLFEFGMEFTKVIYQVNVFKCAISSVVLEIKRECDKMIEIFSMGDNISHSSHLVEKACAFCCSDIDVGGRIRKTGFLLRSEIESDGDDASSTSASAVEITSSMLLDINIEAIELFLNLVLEGLLSPVFISRGQQAGQMLLGSAIWSIVSKLYFLFQLPRSNELIETDKSYAAGNSLFRLYFSQLLVLIPLDDEQGCGSFGLSFSDVEIATGNSLKTGANDTTSYRRVVEKNCSHVGQSWLNAYQLSSDMSDDTFYALRSKHSLFQVSVTDGGSGNTFQAENIFPISSINWSLPVGISGSISPPFDVFAVKNLSLSIMKMGMPLSSIYFKLYKLSPQNESAQSDFSLAAARLHDTIGSYHHRMYNLIGQVHAEVERLRQSVWLKENERVGALVLASSIASGWIRVGEDLSFSHRLFSSATFWKYWMVLDKSLLVLYKTPGSSVPSFVIPLRKSSQLRSITLSSSSNKTSGIVGNHIGQQGFALYDSDEGGATGLFFVTADESDYNMWIQSISMALENVDDTDTLDNDYIIEEGMNIEKSGVEESNGIIENQDTKQFLGDLPASTTSVPLQAPRSKSPSIAETIPDPTISDPFSTFDEPAHLPTVARDEMPPVQAPVDSLDSSEAMDDVEMEDVSLSGSENGAAVTLLSPSTDSDMQLPPIETPISSQPHAQNAMQSLPMRERLALAKEKSKLASSKFGLALKAKGGMLTAVDESGRDIDGGNQAPPPKRSLAVGQKMSMLKRNANTKLTAARASLQDQVASTRAEASPKTDFPESASTSSSTDELSGNSRKLVVAEKMSLLKKNASTKLTSVRSSMEVSLSSSHDEVSASRSGKQELRKKLANLDQSMSNTVRRLKIDEKVTQLSAAVKNDAMMQQISNSVSRRVHTRNNSEHTRQRIGIGEESKAIKPIKFDARATFSSACDLPLKVKSVPVYGDNLTLNERLLEKVSLLQKIEGSWVLGVNAIKVVGKSLSVPESLTNDESQQEGDCKWKYKIVATDMSSSDDDAATAISERTLTELLTFHTQISEIIATLPSTSEFSSQGGSDTSILDKLSPMDRLRVAGNLLQRILELNNAPASSSSMMRGNHCELIKAFVLTLLECHMPEQAISATKTFLNIPDSSSQISIDCGTYLTNGTGNETSSLDEAFDAVSFATTLDKQTVQGKSIRSFDAESAQNSSLLNVIMDGYTKAIRERDEALASLATTSIINDNRIMQEQLRKSKTLKPQEMNNKAGQSDEDMLALCKQLGNEIALRTAAETEINRLNELLQFERKIAQAKADECLAKLAICEKGSFDSK